MAKLKLDELVPDKYYCFKNEYYYSTYYICFEKIVDNFIHSYHYEFKETDGEILYNEFKEFSFCSVLFYDESVVEEVDISYLYKYYPKNHKHLIEYRKKKLNKLLTC